MNQDEMNRWARALGKAMRECVWEEARKCGCEDFLKKVERETGSICAPIHLSGGGMPPEVIHGGKCYSIEEWRVKSEEKKDAPV